MNDESGGALRDLTSFPGGELVAEGLADLLHGIESESSLLVRIARPRLVGMGFDVPKPTGTGPLPEHLLFRRIEARCPQGAHAEYNSLIQTLVSFQDAYTLVFRRSGPLTNP